MINLLINYLPTIKIPLVSRSTFFNLLACLLVWTTLSSTLLPPVHTEQSAALHNNLALPMPIPQTVELHGSLIAQTNKASVQMITYVIALGAMRTPINLAANSLVINYRDANQRLPNLAWAWEFLEGHDQDTLLEAGELVRITVPLADRLVHPLAPNMAFVLDVIPAQGAILVLKGQTPPQLEASTELILR